MKRVWLLNALILAVLSAAIALAYFGYSYTNEAASGERAAIQGTMRELAEEKILGIEAQLLDADQKLFEAISLDPLPDLDKVTAASGAVVNSVFVLDEQLKIVPGGHFSRRPSADAKAFREAFEARIAPGLPLASQPIGVRGHLHMTLDERPYLFSYQRRTSAGHAYYVVIEADLAYLVGALFQQYFGVRTPRLYQVVDEQGRLVFGSPFLDANAGLVLQLPFSETVDQWSLRVAQRDVGAQAVRGRRRLVDFISIGIAVTIVIAGLGFLIVAMRRERRSNDLKSEFISNVSHELKTPLSIISLFGEMLALGRVSGPAQANEYAEIIWRESVRLGRLIDNVLDFAKIERGLGSYEFGDVDPVGVVERTVELSRRRVAAAELQLEVELAQELEPIRMDANAYTLAVLNLVDNAIKYAASGKRIVMKLQRQGGAMVLSVQDFGPGIEPTEQGQIFERFYRARAVRLKPIRGSGIGLALVRHIARAHGGDVLVESELGEGSTFRLTIPMRSAGPGEERLDSYDTSG